MRLNFKTLLSTQKKRETKEIPHYWTRSLTSQRFHFFLLAYKCIMITLRIVTSVSSHEAKCYYKIHCKFKWHSLIRKTEEKPIIEKQVKQRLKHFIKPLLLKPYRLWLQTDGKTNETEQSKKIPNTRLSGSFG